MEPCVDPYAHWVECFICGRLIKTCERKEPLETNGCSDYGCPQHPEGSELSDGNWVCSGECWDEYVGE